MTAEKDDLIEATGDMARDYDILSPERWLELYGDEPDLDSSEEELAKL